jgi:hypothetical protein
MTRLFTPQHGGALWLYILGALVISGVIFFVLTLVPGRGRKPLIAALTFLAGLFFAAEFFLPVKASGPDAGKNFLTAYLQPVSDAATVMGAFALGIGVYSLLAVHVRAVGRRREGWGFSVALLVGILLMAIPAILKEYHPNSYNKGLFTILFKGGINNLDSAMFSLVAFYIVSAAYRAFRIRSLEATILMAAAFIVMLGQVALGQALTASAPTEGFGANLHVENIRNWILTRVNSPANLAINFGLSIGVLATSLRLWLSLERGSYFDEEL